ncbi:MAG TPA: flagellar assembly protein FliX [Pseudolabrys sp.]|nr:flagellar assembly protein FliX [Pseudolabrys sp.]
MRVQGPGGAAVAAARSNVRRAGVGNFAVSEEEAPHGNVAATNLRAISTVDALIALQAIDDPAERRKRAARHGRRALDELDALKVSLLDGSIDQSTYARLKVVAEGLEQSSGEAGLDAVLAEIGLRIAVELAKAGVR